MSVADQHATETAAQRFNTRLALWTTRVVGTMWCAYAFAALDCLALPEAIRGGMFGMVQWLASFFLQLVLLSIIMVGQDVQAKAADARAEATFNDAEAILHGEDQIAAHLAVQDELLHALSDQISALAAGARMAAASSGVHRFGMGSGQQGDALGSEPEHGLGHQDEHLHSEDDGQDPERHP